MFAPGGVRLAREALLRALAPHRPYLALTLLACLLYLPSVWGRGLWSPDEPRYAEVAREMVASGEYALPHLNGEIYSEKPPLYLWLGIAASKLPGMTLEGGLRLVSVLSAWGVLLMTFALARRLGEARAGWLSAVALASSVLFALHASSGVIDMTLTFFVVASIACGVSAQESRSPILWACFYLMAGLAVFCKGPVGLIVPAMVLIISAWRAQGARGLLASHVVWGMPLALSMVALWLWVAITRGGDAYASAILFKQTVGRAYQSWHHKQPIEYFLKVFPATYLPWTFILPSALYGAWRIARGRGAPGESSRGAPLALSWFASTFLFFSLISGKKTRYLLPLFPAASMLVGIELARLGSGIRDSRLRRLLPLAAAAILVTSIGAAVTAAGLGGLGPLLGHIEGISAEQLADLGWLAHPWGCLLLVIPGAFILGLGALSLGKLRRDEQVSQACLVCGWLAAMCWVAWVAVPALDGIKSARHLARVASAASTRAGASGLIITYRDSFAGAFNFYLERDHLPRAADPAGALSLMDGQPGAVVIAEKGRMQSLAAQVRGLDPIDCRRLGDESVCVAQYEPPPSGSVSPADPGARASRHVIYLHGRIIQEQQSARPHHPQHGYYELEKILDTLRQRGFAVSGEMRPKSATVSDSADRVVAQVRHLLESGVPADHITVVGGSMGASIALLASARLQAPDVRFGILGACLSENVRALRTEEGVGPAGHLLAIREASDDLTTPCPAWDNAPLEPSAGLVAREIVLDTGLGHGFLYRPLPEWVDPIVDWASASR